MFIIYFMSFNRDTSASVTETVWLTVSDFIKISIRGSLNFKLRCERFVEDKDR